jgi:hypothetical protein
MSKSNIKIIYSLRIHIELQRMGFTYITEMKNPKNPRFNCWVYEETPEFAQTYDSLLKKEGHSK